MTKSLFAALVLAAALSAAEPRGHWTGSIEAPNRTIEVIIDLDKSGDAWVGSLAIPAQNAKGIPLEDIRLDSGKWTFKVPAAPGTPVITATLSEDGQALNGEVAQNGLTMPIALKHAGAPQVELPKKSPALPDRFLGTWEGTLEGPGLRLRVELVNRDGGARALLTSLDQGAGVMPATSVTHKDAVLEFELTTIRGSYRGTLDEKGAELKGEWSQSGNTLPLALKKAKP